MAISSRVAAFSPLQLSKPTAPCCSNRMRVLEFKKIQESDVSPLLAIGRFGSSGGGPGLLERPTFDQSQFDPIIETEAGGDIGRVADKKGPKSGDSYRVLLLNDLHHTEKLVEKVLPQVVPSVTPADARRIFHESQQNGAAVVVVALKEHAEFYAQMMFQRGLRSTIEPDSNMA